MTQHTFGKPVRDDELMVEQCSSPVKGTMAVHTFVQVLQIVMQHILFYCMTLFTILAGCDRKGAVQKGYSHISVCSAVMFLMTACTALLSKQFVEVIIW